VHRLESGWPRHCQPQLLVTGREAGVGNTGFVGEFTARAAARGRPRSPDASMRTLRRSLPWPLLRPFLAELDRGRRTSRLDLRRFARAELAEPLEGILAAPQARALIDVESVVERSQSNAPFGQDVTTEKGASRAAADPARHPRGAHRGAQCGGGSEALRIVAVGAPGRHQGRLNQSVHRRRRPAQRQPGQRPRGRASAPDAPNAAVDLTKPTWTKPNECRQASPSKAIPSRRREPSRRLRIRLSAGAARW
jgi:hypothetical protein